MVSLTRDELVRVLSAAHERNRRDWLLLLITFSHGLRASEAVALTTAHFRDGEITVKRLKGSLATTQPLLEHPDPLLNEKAAVDAYLAQLLQRNSAITNSQARERCSGNQSRAMTAAPGGGPNSGACGPPFLFPSDRSASGHLTRFGFVDLMRRYCRLAGIPAKKATPHKLKHTCAMLAIREAGIENVRTYLGHKNISSTGAYLKVDQEAASSAVGAAFGGKAAAARARNVQDVRHMRHEQIGMCDKPDMARPSRADVARKAWETRRRNLESKRLAEASPS